MSDHPKDPKEKTEIIIMNKNEKTMQKIIAFINKKKAENLSATVTAEKLSEYLKVNDIDIFNLQDENGCTLAHKFCSERNYFQLECLLSTIEKADNFPKKEDYFLSENKANLNVFETAAELGDYKIFKMLYKYIKGNNQILGALIKQGRKNVFHIAALKDLPMSLLFFFDFYSSSACLNATDKTMQAPLHVACQNSNVKTALFLLNLGADVNQRDKEGRTPLFYAVQSGNTRIIIHLLINGADKNIADHSSKKAINYSKDIAAYDILENKRFFDVAFKCKIEYKSLKNLNKSLLMLLVILFSFISQLLILIGYSTTKFNATCLNPYSFTLETTVTCIVLCSETLVAVLCCCFRCLKNSEICGGFNSQEKKNKGNKHKSYFRGRYDSSSEKCEALISQNEDESHKLYEMYYYNENICGKCRRFMGRETKHCIACDQCIDNWDHHCFWLNVCINTKNRLYFMVFLCGIIAVIVVNLFMSVLVLVDLLRFPKIYWGILHGDCLKGEQDIKSFNGLSVLLITLDILYFLIMLYLILNIIIPFFFQSKISTGGIDADKTEQIKNKIIKSFNRSASNSEGNSLGIKDIDVSN